MTTGQSSRALCHSGAHNAPVDSLLTAATKSPDPRQSETALDPADCRHIIYDEGWHLLLRDLQRQRAWQDILSWLDDPGASKAGIGCDATPG